MNQRGTLLEQPPEIGILQIDSMNKQCFRPEQSQSVEIGQRTATGRLKRNPPFAPSFCKHSSATADEQTLICRLGNVCCHSEVLALGIFIHGFIQCCRHGVWGVRRHADAQRFCFARSVLIDLVLQISKRFRQLTWCRPEHLLIRNALQSKLAHRVPRRTEIHYLGNACHTCTTHFYRAKLRRKQHVSTREYLILCMREAWNPVPEREVIEEAAEDCELEMAMSIDEAGNDGTTREAHGSDVVAIAGLPVIIDRRYSSVFDTDLAVANRRRRTRANPIGFVDRHAVKTCDRIVRRSMRLSSTAYPIPDSFRCVIWPSAEPSTAGSIMSSAQ